MSAPASAAAADGAEGATFTNPAADGSDGPALSEEAFLRLGKQHPPQSVSRREGHGEHARPGDVTVTEPGPAARASATGSPPSALRQSGAMGPPRSSSPLSGLGSAANLRSASPRHLSPATSQIFERDVQESTLAPELSPAIPSHIQTEDHIPAVLEASSEVITNHALGPDEVEIVTHNSHQPAAAAVPGATLADSQQSASLLSLPGEGTASPPSGTEGLDEVGASSTHGAVDPSDPRRLSFISFADLVHAEHDAAGKEPLAHIGSPVSLAASLGAARSPSPATSPIRDRHTHLSSVSSVSPPRSGSAHASAHGLELSPSRAPDSELNVETMRQAMAKTTSAPGPGSDAGASSMTLPGV